MLCEEKDRVIRGIHCTTFVGKLRKGLFRPIFDELFHVRWFLKVSSPLPPPLSTLPKVNFLSTSLMNLKLYIDITFSE